MGPLMSATTTPRRTGPTLPGETRICIPGVNWRFYEWLVDSIPEGTGVRVALDGTDVEIMTTSPEHEDFKELLGRFVGLVAEELGIPADRSSFLARSLRRRGREQTPSRPRRSGLPMDP